MDYQTIRDFVVKFEQNFGTVEGVLYSRAPGRVNLIGEHTDYNGGYVMPMAVNREVTMFFRPTGSGPVRLWSQNYQEWDEFDLDEIEHNDVQAWANYIRGVAWALQDAGHQLRPIEGMVFGDVPIGSGLSSSAAVEVASAGAFCEASGIEIAPRDLALLCQKAENRFVGVNCGIMDQFVSLHARRDRAILLDCRSLDYRELPLDGSAVRVVVCNTMVRHELGSSAYNERRASCERAAELLNERAGGIEQLRDVTPAVLEEYGSILDEVTLKRARHVVSEIDRTERGAAALEGGAYGEFGRLMNESHESLRTDYEVSCAELDAMVESARRQPGCLGARMVGAGFGGCTVNLVRSEHADDFAAAVAAAYHAETGIDAEVYQFLPAAGAEVRRC
jgi:galactokinase